MGWSRLRGGLFILTSLLVGCLVAISGAIAFIGLIVPHIARLLVGSDHRRVLPVTALAGGVPFFLWLLRRRSTDAR